MNNISSSILPTQTLVATYTVGSEFVGSWPSYYTFVFAVLLLSVAHWSMKPSTRLCGLDLFPHYQVPKWKWVFGSEGLLKESYEKFRDHAYQIHGPDGVQVLLPSRYINEAKLLSDHFLDTEVEQYQTLQTKYTGFPVESDKRQTVINTLRTHIAPAKIASVSLDLKPELDHLVSNEFPPCNDWTRFKFQPFCLRAIARMSGYIFVGPSVSRQEEWIDISINFAMYVFVAGAKLQLFPNWMRPLGQYGVSELAKIRRCVSTAERILEPVVEEKQLQSLTPGAATPSSEKTLLDAIVDDLPEEIKWDSRLHAQLQLSASAASVHPTSQILCECMYDLAARPELQEELRQEAHEILEAGHGWAKKDSASKMRKMDSFMREVQRFRGNMATFLRRVMKPITFADGMHLPAGTSILCPQVGISLDERFHSYADVFDPMRFYRMREEAQDQQEGNRWQFTSPSDFNMHFGIGRHTCPGRFLASTNIKLVLAYFLLNYDVRFRPGAERPKSWTIVMTKSPDPSAELEFKRRVPLD